MEIANRVERAARLGLTVRLSLSREGLMSACGESGVSQALMGNQPSAQNARARALHVEKHHPQEGDGKGLPAPSKLPRHPHMGSPNLKLAKDGSLHTLAGNRRAVKHMHMGNVAPDFRSMQTVAGLNLR